MQGSENIFNWGHGVPPPRGGSVFFIAQIPPALSDRFCFRITRAWGKKQICFRFLGEKPEGECQGRAISDPALLFENLIFPSLA
jgi:hypothetical protein